MPVGHMCLYIDTYVFVESFTHVSVTDVSVHVYMYVYVYKYIHMHLSCYVKMYKNTHIHVMIGSVQSEHKNPFARPHRHTCTQCIYNVYSISLYLYISTSI